MFTAPSPFTSPFVPAGVVVGAVVGTGVTTGVLAGSEVLVPGVPGTGTPEYSMTTTETFASGAVVGTEILMLLPFDGYVKTWAKSFPDFLVYRPQRGSLKLLVFIKGVPVIP
jgi:hypothetical protein